jgi:hypothetical protein
MRVTIVGTGTMARGVAARALAGGHHVTFVGTDLAKAEDLADELTGQGAVRGGETIDGDLVILAVPFTQAPHAVRQHAAELAGAVIVFNTAFAGTLVAGAVAGQPLDIFMAGDDDEAKNLVARLIRDGGMRPIDTGALVRSRELEALGYLHIIVQAPLATAFASAVKIVA